MYFLYFNIFPFLHFPHHSAMLPLWLLHVCAVVVVISCICCSRESWAQLRQRQRLKRERERGRAHASQAKGSNNNCKFSLSVCTHPPPQWHLLGERVWESNQRERASEPLTTRMWRCQQQQQQQRANGNGGLLVLVFMCGSRVIKITLRVEKVQRI